MQLGPGPKEGEACSKQFRRDVPQLFFESPFGEEIELHRYG